MKNKLNAQELRNILYAGPWIEDAKAYLSQNDGYAPLIGELYLKGVPENQDFLETLLEWSADDAGMTVEEYMELHQFDENANELKRYYERVIIWVNCTFTNYRRHLMKGLPWGIYYNAYKDNQYDPRELEFEIRRLLAHPLITNPKWIYIYLLETKSKV